ncbi:SRPBCC family protein [Cellulomonas hominis]|uniref:SRPBCC family protein n=1 Tax=Cellulomonas hominis TaxID=156981 RepID=UPI001B9EC8B9|nr:SRPBCC family protein [Cellulomonas hominis]VTR75516.1 hypothetical protein CHMI_00262 [Cellulomonas hominis]
MTRTRALRTVLVGAAVATGYAVARHRGLRWGATQVELSVGLAGDELLPDADLVATRAITVRAPAERVWPWLVQIGQGRGGFYSYDALENLAGLGIRSADSVEDRWQDLAVGDEVRLGGPLTLAVARLEPGRALVLHGAGPALPDEDAAPFDFVWSFVLRPGVLPGTSRLVIRERYGYTEPWARWMVEGVSWVSLLMTERMLRGVRDRAERSDTATGLAAGPA